MQTLHQTYNPKNCKVIVALQLITNNPLVSPMTNKASNVTANPYMKLTTLHWKGLLRTLVRAENAPIYRG